MLRKTSRQKKRTRDYDSCIISYVLLHVLCHGLSMLPPYNYFCVCVMPISCRPKSCDLRMCGTWILTCGNLYVSWCHALQMWNATCCDMVASFSINLKCQYLRVDKWETRHVVTWLCHFSIGFEALQLVCSFRSKGKG